MANMVFNKVRTYAPKSNKFDLSHQTKFSCKDGYIIPVLCQEILPGDRWRADSEVFIRLAPMVSPIMQNMNVTIHNFYVPVRLVWDESEPYFTGGEDGLAAPVHPYITINEALAAAVPIGPSSLLDYIGFPVVSNGDAIDNPVQISALPFRALCQVYNDYYRDQNVTSAIDFPKTSGAVDQPTAVQLLTLRRRAWEKDYFTSALPFAQRGPAVPMPLEGDVSVGYKPALISRSFPPLPPAPADGDLQQTGGHMQDSAGNDVYVDNIDTLTINATTTIDELNRSIKIQQWLQKNALGGARYVEQLRAHFDVISPDARLQRPEFLSGSKLAAVISEVLSTFQDPDGAGKPQANMAGHGISVGHNNGFHYRALEHGVVLGIMRVLPRTAYQQGIPRDLFRNDKFDYAFPELANIGEQAILNKEVCWDGSQSNPNDTFGYQSRYAEYKYMPSTVHGAMKTTLDYWHMGRKFDPSSPPVLNGAFVQADPTLRIFAVDDPDVEQLYFQLYHRLSALRPLPYYGTPMI